MENSPEILTILNTLELQRVAELKRFGMVALVVLLVNILFFIKFRSNFLPSLGLGFIVLIGSYYLINSKYKDEVQTLLVPKIIQKVDPDYQYEPDIKIDINKFNDLKFFSHKLDDSQSDGRVSLSVKNNSLFFWFVTLESSKIDTEEGRHATPRFDGLFVELELSQKFNQRYLIGTKSQRTPIFEAGDYLNPPHMGLKFVGTLSDGWSLFSEDGSSNLRDDMLEKLKVFKEEFAAPMWVIFENNRVYILLEGIENNFEISLFHSLKSQNIIKKYVRLLKEVKGLI